MLKFKLLRIIADQFYYNVREVRTKDDTTITVKLMIFFELVGSRWSCIGPGRQSRGPVRWFTSRY